MFDEKTGNPSHDNEARRLNRDVRRAAAEMLRVTGPGWKKRRVTQRIERATYAELVVRLVTARIKEDT